MVCGEVTSAVASDARPDGECVAMMRLWHSTRMVHVHQPYQVTRIAFSEATAIDTLSGYTLRAVYGKLDETSLSCKVNLRKAFERIGLELVDLKFMKIDMDEKYRERLFFMQTGGVGAAGVLEAETRKGMAESLGKSPGAAVGAGIMMMAPGGMGQAGTMGGGGGVAIRSCMKCGGQSPATSKFCNNCGAKFPGDEAPAEGGAKVPKFCPECGAKTEGAKSCPGCDKKLA